MAQQTTQITIIGLEQCLASAVVGLCDAFSIANAFNVRMGASVAAFSPTVASPDGRPVAGFGGQTLEVAGAYRDVAHSDVIIVPPVVDGLERCIAAQRPLIDWLRHQGERGVLLASVCSGAFLIAETGLLNGRRATTNHFMAEDFRSRYPSVELVSEQRLVDSGPIVCAGSTTAYLHLAVHLIERFAGHGLAVFVAKNLIVDKNPGSQLPYFVFAHRKEHGDSDIRALQDWMELRYPQSLTLRALCEQAAMSERSLGRRFLAATGDPPLVYLRRIRIEMAKRLLESTALTIDEVTDAVGYLDRRSFGRLFKQWVGATPRDYRQRFGAAGGLPS